MTEDSVWAMHPCDGHASGRRYRTERGADAAASAPRVLASDPDAEQRLDGASREEDQEAGADDPQQRADGLRLARERVDEHPADEARPDAVRDRVGERHDRD